MRIQIIIKLRKNYLFKVVFFFLVLTFKEYESIIDGG